MAGLLDFNPAASPAQRMGTSGSGGVTLQDLLFGVGIGLLGNRNAAQGLAQGGLLAMQTGRQRQQDERQARRDAMQEAYLGGQMQNWQQKNQTEQQRLQQWQGLLSSPNIPENLRPVLGAMGPQVGAQFLAQQMAPPKPDNQLVEVFDANSPTGTRFVPRAEAAGMPGKMPSGLNIEFGPDGRPTRIAQGRGAGGGNGLSTPTTNKVQEQLLAAGDRFKRISDIRNSFKPEYQQLGTRWQAVMTSAMEKGGVPVDPADAAALRDYTQFKSRAYNDLNQTLKEMSGAAITPQEAERLLKVLPNPGTGLFDGDSPTEFKAKTDDIYRQTQWAQARLQYINAHGLNADAMKNLPLEQMPQLINKRGSELAAQFRAGGVPADQITAQVRNALAREFGIPQ